MQLTKRASRWSSPACAISGINFFSRGWLCYYAGMSEFLKDVRTRVKETERRTILLPEAADERILEAAAIMQEEGIAEPLLVGSAEGLATARATGLATVSMEEPVSVVLEQLLLEIRAPKAGTKDELKPEVAKQLARDPLFYAMYLLREEKADGLVAGAVRTTAEVLRAGLWLVGKAEGITTVSSSFYMVVPPFRGGSDEEVLTFTDCAVVPQPTAEQLADIAIAAADARRAIVGDEPRVALLSFGTKGSGGGGGSVALVREALERVQARRPSLVIDGELQVDAALVAGIAERKAPGSPIAGKANVLVFPSLDAGNIAYKLIAQLTPGAKAVGPILQGMAKPISDLSRGVKSEELVDIATIVASQAKSKAKNPQM